MKFCYIIGLTLIFVLFNGCIEIWEQEGEKGTTTTSIVVEETTTTIKTTTTAIVTTSTTSPSIPSIITTTTTTSKLSFSCNDYCKKEGYEGGKCRKTPAQCRIYGINEIYKPLGNKYCPRGRGYDACCCVFSVTTTVTTIVPEEVTNITILLTPIKENEASGFEKIKPIDTTIKYQSNGLLSFKILNVIGDIKILNISSKKCSQGIGLGNLDKTQLEVGEDTVFRAWCEKKAEGEGFEVDLKFTYKELISDVVGIYDEDVGVVSGIVEE
jgi:hypothetical protein